MQVVTVASHENDMQVVTIVHASPLTVVDTSFSGPA
jgi:hypothetical protein